ncbi:hypothetical protein [Lacticaseibacillus sharpeae]|nr:hypothetical protein [Lacticaseibacillus sharpeae]
MPESTTINYAEAYMAAVQESFYPTSLYSSALWLSPANAGISFLGAKTIKVPTLKINAGRTDHTRRSSTAIQANYSDDWTPMQLTHEREWSTLVDPIDVDETNQVVSIANVTRQFNLDEKMPEQDRYMFSKLYADKTAKNDGGIYTESLDASNILTIFDELMEQMDEKRVPAVGRLLYVNSHTNTILKQADALNRTLLISNPNNISRAVHTLDEVTIVVVPSDLIQTKFDFAVGSKTVDDAQQIDMMLVYNGVQIAPQKYSFVGFDQPNAANGGNYLYREISYDDVFLLPTKSAGIAFHVSDKAKPATTDGTGTAQGEA